jgi:hypothetical protein
MTGHNKLRSYFRTHFHTRFRTSGKLLPLVLIFCLCALSVIGCSGVFYAGKANAADTNEEAQASPEMKSVTEQPAEQERDLALLLAEVSQTTAADSNMQEDSIVISLDPPQDIALAAASDEPTLAAETETAGSATLESPAGSSQCAAPFSNNYRKSLAFTSFPRSTPTSSNAGALYKVDQHLPMLLSANLTTRHATLSPVHLPEGFYSADYQSEARAAAQAQLLARKHRTQFIVSGEVKDMSMTYPDKAFTHNAYRRLVNSATNLFNADSPRNSKSRIFSFQLQLRDGFTGQVVFDHYYETYGNWDTKESAEMGFGSPRFWQTDYGRKVQQLVAKASDEMAARVHCRPYMTRVDLRPGHQQVIIHSGANNGLRTGDALALHQLVMHPVTGEYDSFNAHVVDRNTLVYLTEVYPSHSVANIGQDVLLNGQYVALAP